MKKLIYCVATLVATLFAASCAQENLQPVGGNIVSFKVEIPEVATKAEAVGNDAKMIDDLVYAVYRTTAGSVAEALENWNDKTTFLYAINSPAELKRFKDGTDIISIELLNDQNHIVLLWAQHNDTWVDEQGENIKLTEITYPSPLEVSAHVADKYAAFSAVKFIAANDKSNTEPIKLTRPFAQINLATVDPREYDVVINSTTLTVNAAGDNFNVASQLPAGSQDVTYSWAGKVYEDKLTANLQNYDHYLAMGYVFSAGNVSVHYVIETEKHGIIDNTVTNVPVEKNYRTNIIGNLLTSDVDYNVVLDENWGDTGKNMEVIIDGLVKNINGDYEISTDDALIYAINNLWVDERGVADSATFYVYPQEYNITDDQIRDIHVTSGTLKVIKDVPVMTRSNVFDGIVIKGLSKPLIATVGVEATVVISGVTIQNYEGDGQQGALVGENDGNVIIEDCVVIIDEEGTVDSTIESLVGDNNAIVGTVKEPSYEIEGNSAVVYDAVQLAAAFAAAEVENIVLGANIAVEDAIVFPEGRTATLDLKGFELTIAGEDKVSTTYAINNHGTLTIKDSYGIGAVNSRGIYNGYVPGGDAIPTAKLIIEGGNFNAKGTNGGAAVYNYGQLDVNGGKFASIGGYALNNQAGGVMTVTSADVRGGIYNCGIVTVTSSKVYQHISDRHAIYNWAGSVTIESGEFDSESGNELIFADGQNASVTIKGGEFHKTAKSWLYAAVTGKDISFEIQGGTHYGYVNQPEMTVDTFRPNGDKFLVTGGSFNFDVNSWCHTDYKAVKNAETAMWDVVEKVYVAKIGEDGYESLQEAVEAVKDGETITLVANETFTETNRTLYPGTTVYVGIYHYSDKSFTLDLNGKTINNQEGAVGECLFYFKNDGAKANVITLKNGTIDAGSAFNAINTSTTNGQKITINVEDIELVGNKSNGAVCKIRGGTEFNVNKGTVITAENNYTGIEAVGNNTVVNIYEDTEIYQNGTSSYVGAIVGASYNATLNIYGGKGASKSCGIIVMTTGGTVNVSGGEWTSNNDGTVSNDNKGVLVSQNSRWETGWASKSIINVTGGTFKGGYNCYCDGPGLEADDAQINIKGGNFNADPTNYLVEGYIANPDENGIFSVTEFVPAAKVGNTEYGSIDEAIAAWTNNATLTLLADVTLSDVVILKSTEHHILDLGTYTMTAADKKNAIEIVPEGEGAGTAAKSCLTINADATNPGSMNAGSKACVYYNKTNGINDRIMVTINGGIFDGTISSSSNNGGQACPYFVFNGGVFNKSINLSKAMLKVTGGIFHGMFSCTGDSTAHRLISGGTFKSWTFMTADAANKFSVGTDKQVYNVGVYVNDEGYLVVGGPVITEFGDKFAAKATNATKWSSYLQYSSAAANGLYYTNAEMAIKKHGEANVVLK